LEDIVLRGEDEEPIIFLKYKGEKEPEEMSEISKQEKDSLLYYQGGGAEIELSAEQQNLRAFYDVANSYLVINALLMPGVSNERARLKEEERQVSLVVFEHMEELLEVYCRLYSAMCKYTFDCEHDEKYHTYRDDRMNTLEFLEHGQMYSFMSTNRGSGEGADFRDKDGVLLLEVEAPGSVEHIDVNAVLQEKSKYPHEQEILFAPFVLLDKESMEMTEKERAYQDMHGDPPRAKYLLHLRFSSIASCETAKHEEALKDLYTKIMDVGALDVSRQIWETFMKREEPPADAVKRYTEWKEKLQIYLRMRFAGIKYEVTHDKRDTGENQSAGAGVDAGEGRNPDVELNQEEARRKKLEELEEEIKSHYNSADQKRMKYKKCVQIVNVAVSVLYPLMTLCVALSFLEELQTGMKVAGLLLSAIGSIIPLVAQGLAWNEKLQQRTTTYLKLDELLRDIRCENFLGEERLEGYVTRYKAIISADNEMGRQNVVIQGKYWEKAAGE